MKDLTNKKIMVTGGAGFIGSHTVDALVDRGAKVFIIDDLSTGRRENCNPKAKLYEISLNDEALTAIMEQEKPDIIYHFAFFVLVPKSAENPLLDFPVLEGTLRMLQKAKELKVQKIVFASSGFLYGNTTNLPVPETAPVDPVTAYVVAKHAIENYLEFYRRMHGLSYVILRYPAVYGPRQVTGAMADYIRKLRSGQQAEIWGDGEKTRDYLFVSDVVHANILALEVSHDHPHPIFNLGTGQETTLNVLYQSIAKILGVSAKPIYNPDRKGEQMRYALHSGKIQNELGWKPTVTLEEGLKRVIASWEQ